MGKVNSKKRNHLSMRDNLMLVLFREKEIFNGLMGTNMKVSSKQANCMVMGNFKKLMD